MKESYLPTMMRSSFYIGHCPNRAYVYIWFSCRESVVYVGQTNDEKGVVGRAAQHVSSDGSLRMRLLDEGYELDQIDDFLLLSYPLPQHWRFSGVESAGREAVEYFVQVGIRDSQSEFENFLTIVSTVRPVRFFDMDGAKQLADDIVDDFKAVYALTRRLSSASC